MFNIAGIIHTARTDSPLSPAIAEAKEPNRAQALVPSLEKRKSSRHQRSTKPLKPATDPKPSSIEQTPPKMPEPVIATPIASGSKCDHVLGLLRREGGATNQDLMAATNWQAHSVRGFLSGTVRKKLGLNLISEVNGERIRRYRIEAISKPETCLDINQAEPVNLPPFGPFRMPKDAEAAVGDKVL